MSKFFSNKEIAKLFEEIAAAYAAKGENRFKIIAYENAASSIEHATSELKDLWDDGKIDTVPGLGKSIIGHLDELFKTGKVKHFEEIKKGLPEGMFVLLSVPNMGPKTAFKLAEALNIKNLDDLKKAAESGKIRELAGFGERSEQEILESLGRSKKNDNRMVLPVAFTTAERVLSYLQSQKDCKQAEPLGSLRRMVATVGDIDIAVASDNPKNIIDHFKNFREIGQMLGAGPRKAAAVLKNGIQVDLMVESPDAFGALLQHFTGSKNHNIHLRELAIKKGFSLSDYGIKVKGKLKKFKTEEEFYKFLEMDWIVPELREDTGEIESSLNNQLPKVVETEDIKGDIHVHSSYPIEPSHDLGKDSFETLIERALKLGYQYIGLSDHSPSYSKHTEDQIVTLIRKRTEKIEKLRAKYRKIKILNLLEIDILTNGELSVPEKGLKLLDGTIAGIHSSHSQDKGAITKRLLVALDSPYVQVIAHPTGRLLQQRESYDADWHVIFEKAAKTKTILEINAWPSRLDLPDVLVKDAIAKGVKLIIDTDSHAVEHMDNMRFGVAVARRGWAEAKDIVNTYRWENFKRWFNYKNVSIENG